MYNMKYSYDCENITIYYTNPIVVDVEQHTRNGRVQ